MENITKTYTWNILAEAINNLSAEQRKQPAQFVVNSDTDTSLHQIGGMAIITEDVMVNIDEDEDCGTLQELKRIHGDEFNLSDYKLSTAVGTAIIFEQGTEI